MSKYVFTKENFKPHESGNGSFKYNNPLPAGYNMSSDVKFSCRVKINDGTGDDTREWYHNNTVHYLGRDLYCYIANQLGYKDVNTVEIYDKGNSDGLHLSDFLRDITAWEIDETQGMKGMKCEMGKITKLLKTMNDNINILLARGASKKNGGGGDDD